MSVYFKDVEPVKRSAMIESQDSFTISSEHSIGSRGETTCNHGALTSSDIGGRMNGANTEESFQTVSHEYESERLGQIRR